MTERIPSDHDTVASHRLTLATVGRTDRPEVTLPSAIEDDVAEGDVLRLFVDGDEGHALVERDLSGALVLRGAFPNARLARDESPPADEDLIAAWRDDRGLEAGAALLLDEVTPGFAYGLRAPGERVLYPDREPPADDLAAIAEDLEE